ncbi:ferritin family protein [Thermodesulfobacteriota bacterium]
MFSNNEIFDLALRIEKNGESFFRNAMEKVKAPSFKSLFEWLAEQEVKHKEWFARKKATLENTSESHDIDQMGSDMLQDILGDQSFSLQEVDLGQVKSVQDILDLGIEFEKDTILFFEMILSMSIDADTGAELKAIIEEEKHHIELLQEKRKHGAAGLEILN